MITVTALVLTREQKGFGYIFGRKIITEISTSMVLFHYIIFGKIRGERYV